MSFTQIPSLVSFNPLTTIISADVNANYAAIRNAFNGLVTGSNTIAVDTISENTLNAGVTVNKKFAVSVGVATFASGIALTAGVVSGVATFSSGWSISGGTINVSGATVSGVATFSSGWAISGGVVSGTVTFTSNVTAAGSLNVGGVITVTGNATFGGQFVNRLITVTGGSAGAPAFDCGNAAAGIHADASGNLNIDSGDSAGNVMFFVGASTPPVHGTFNYEMRTTLGANFVIGATLATSATLGFIYLSTAPGTSTGVPAGRTGTVAMCYDTTNNRLQVYNAGWKTVLLA